MKIGKAVLIEKVTERQKELLMSYGETIKDDLSKAEAHSMISKLAQEWALGNYEDYEDAAGEFWMLGWDK